MSELNDCNRLLLTVHGAVLTKPPLNTKAFVSHQVLKQKSKKQKTEPLALQTQQS